MRKGLTTLLVILLALGAVLVSCKAEIEAPADELVAVSFEESSSRSITATLEGFNKDNYYWKYAAKKADDSGLTSGATSSYDETGAVFIHEATPGLTGKVPGFSQGLWDFLLFGYKKIEGDNPATTVEESYYYVLIYSGEAKAVTLQTKGDNTAHVVVNPIAEGDGFIKIGEITFIPKKTGDESHQLKFIEVTNPDGSAVSGISYDTTTQTYTVPAGAYKVTVKFTNAAQTIVYGEGYVIATVYSGLTTTIGGNLNELITYAQFDADLNPDAVNVQAESAQIQYGFGDDVEIKTAATAEKKVSATVARSDADAIIASMAAEQAVDTGASTKLKLTLNVDPTDASEQSVTYEIGMKATLTYSKDTQTQTTEKPVTALNNYVVVEIEMSSGLSDVAVKHSDVAMVKCYSLAELDAGTSEDPTHPGFYFYDAAGTLYIKTKNFSPFAISYTAPANYVADVDGVKYGTLAEAIAKVKNDGTSTVTLLADIALEKTVVTTKSFILNLAGYDITAADCRAIHVQEGTLTLTGKGTIAAGTAVSTFGDSSSVIRVGNNAGTAAGLVIGKDVTISSSYCYGVSIFGTETNGQSLEVNGKIKVTGTASAISGNGTSTLTATTITINEGAEVYAENDYAIYHPQKGTLTVAGGTIVGKGGIEAKGGNVIVNGGAITATAPTQSHEEYNNGASTSGYALAAVKNPNYPGDGSIRVNGGMITGKLILATDEEASFTTKLEAAGGTFTVDPTVYAVEGCVVRDNKDGTWTILSAGEIAAQLAIDAGATAVTIDGNYAYGTMSDYVMYRFDASGEVYVYDARNYNGYDGSETPDDTKYTVGKLFANIPGLTVVGLGQNSFKYNTKITSVAFANDITSAYKPFDGNSTVESVDLTNLTTVPDRLFYGLSKVKSVEIPDSVTRVEDFAFYGNAGIKKITVGKNVVYIGYKAFDSCSKLEVLDILGSPEIVNWAGRYLPALTDLYLRGEGTSYNMTYAPGANTKGAFVICQGQSDNPGTFNFNVHVASMKVFDNFIASNGNGKNTGNYKYKSVTVIE